MRFFLPIAIAYATTALALPMHPAKGPATNEAARDAKLDSGANTLTIFHEYSIDSPGGLKERSSEKLNPASKTSFSVLINPWFPWHKAVAGNLRGPGKEQQQREKVEKDAPIQPAHIADDLFLDFDKNAVRIANEDEGDGVEIDQINIDRDIDE
ncbi:hypothetical protein FRB96_006940 [Tulasnella sp. 330]|nr:hypothetical protein FRB96_006940 [Tulasnella sp. 330]KAG8876559.1 hypothetical protein FRB97_004112 [Tulasnella sp. 331]